MNKVFLIGRLSRDPELRHTTSGMPVCQINVAISRPVTQGSEPQTDFINVVVWNKQAENVARYLSKGRQIAIEGRIQTRNYDNNEGKKVYVTEVIASNVQFLESKNAATTNNNGFNSMPEPPVEKSPYDFGGESNQGSNTMNIEENDPFASFGEQVEISDNDLPF